MRRQWCSLGSRGPAHTSSPLSASPNHEHTGLSQVCIPDDKKHSPQKQRLRVPGSDNHEGQLTQARAPPWASASAHPFSLHTPGSSHRSSPSRPPGAFVCPPACPPPSLSQLGMFCLTHLRSIHPSGPRAHCSVPGDRGQPPSPAVSPRYTACLLSRPALVSPRAASTWVWARPPHPRSPPGIRTALLNGGLTAYGLRVLCGTCSVIFHGAGPNLVSQASQ